MELSQWIFVVLLAAAGYAWIAGLLREGAEAHGSEQYLPLVAAILLVSYLGFIAVILISTRDALPAFRVLSVLVFMMLLALVIGALELWQNRMRISRRYLSAALLVDALLLLLTVVGRTERTDTTILMIPLHSIAHAVRYHRATGVIHMSLNALLFVPVGFVHAGILRGVTDRLSGTVPFGMMLSIMIETLQLVLRRGQCDIDDIIANTAGTALGVLVYRALKGRLSRSRECT